MAGIFANNATAAVETALEEFHHHHHHFPVYLFTASTAGKFRGQ